MDELIAMTSRLCVLTPAFLLLKLLLPEGEMKKYAAFAMALVEMGVLLEPVLKFAQRLR